MRSAVEWGPIRESYVEGVVGADGVRTWPSMRAVAQMHNMQGHNVRRQAAQDGWAAQRTTFRETLDRERQTARIKQLAEDAIELDAVAITAAKAGLQLIQHRVGEIMAQAARGAATGRSGIDANEQSALALAGRRWYEIGQLALGQPTDRVEHDHRIEAPARKLDEELEELAREIRERATRDRDEGVDVEAALTEP